MDTQEKNILNYLEYRKIYKQKYLTLEGLYEIGYSPKYKTYLTRRINVINNFFSDDNVEGRLNEILKKIRDLKEVRTLQDISLRKLLKKKLVGELSEDKEADLDDLVDSGTDVYRLTFDTLDLLNVLDYNLIFPEWYSYRFCDECHSDQVVGYTSEYEYEWCFDCFTSELSRFEEEYEVEYESWRDEYEDSDTDDEEQDAIRRDYYYASDAHLYMEYSDFI